MTYKEENNMRIRSVIIEPKPKTKYTKEDKEQLAMMLRLVELNKDRREYN